MALIYKIVNKQTSPEPVMELEIIDNSDLWISISNDNYDTQVDFNFNKEELSELIKTLTVLKNKMI